MITSLNMISDFCDFDESLFDLVTYCYDNEDACDLGKMIQELEKKFIQVATVANDFVALLLQGVPTETSDDSDIEDFFERFGSNTGKLIRFATLFDPK